MKIAGIAMLPIHGGTARMIRPKSGLIKFLKRDTNIHHMRYYTSEEDAENVGTISYQDPTTGEWIEEQY